MTITYLENNAQNTKIRMLLCKCSYPIVLAVKNPYDLKHMVIRLVVQTGKQFGLQLKLLKEFKLSCVMNAITFAQSS